MRLTFSSLKPSAGAAASERASERLAAEIQLIKGKHICLRALDLHIKTQSGPGNVGPAEPVDCEGPDHYYYLNVTEYIL